MQRLTLPTFLLFMSGFALACSSTELDPPEFEGSWDYSIASLSGDGYQCTVADVLLLIDDQITITTADENFLGEFDGTFRDGQMECTGPSGPLAPIPTDPGNVFGDFDNQDFDMLFDNPNWLHEGEINDSHTRLTGTVTRETFLEGNAVTLEGVFEAEK